MLTIAAEVWKQVIIVKILRFSLLIALLAARTVFAVEFSDVVRAAEQGDPEAQLIAGLGYHFGEYGKSREPVEKSSTEAVRWLALASESGSCFAPWFLGGIYAEGKGVSKDEEKAANYFLTAAKRGNVKAQRNIAAYFYYGMSVPQDYNQAYAWASLANYQVPNNKNTQALLNMIIPKLEDRREADVFAAKHLTPYLKPQEDCRNT